MLRSLKFIASWFEPTRTAICNTSLPWAYRWRMLTFQPITWLTYGMKYLPRAFSKRYSVIEIPARGRHTLRAIVFLPPEQQATKLRPLHLDFHGGAFLGGIAEFDAAFCEQVSDRLGAVVISSQYRYAPTNQYPCAHEDAEDAVKWVLENAQSLWRADPNDFTVSGFSAGASLMLTAGTKAKAAVGFFGVVDMRLPPEKKPKPENFPTKDPLFFLMPLFDAYAGPTRAHRVEDSRLNPILKDIDDVPDRVLMLVAGIDILVHEQLTFIEKLRKEQEERGLERKKFEAVVFPRGFHGWIDLPGFAEDRKRVYDTAIDFLSDARTST